mgnify:CR=1 FL=1
MRSNVARRRRHCASVGCCGAAHAPAGQRHRLHAGWRVQGGAVLPATPGGVVLTLLPVPVCCCLQGEVTHTADSVVVNGKHIKVFNCMNVSPNTDCQRRVVRRDVPLYARVEARGMGRRLLPNQQQQQQQQLRACEAPAPCLRVASQPIRLPWRGVPTLIGASRLTRRPAADSRAVLALRFSAITRSQRRDAEALAAPPPLRTFSFLQPEEIPWGASGADFVCESTGA